MTKPDEAVEITQADINAFCAIFDFKPEMVDADGDDKRVLEILARHSQSSIPAVTEDMVEAVWNALKARCAADPEKATRLVMISKADIAAAMKAKP